MSAKKILIFNWKMAPDSLSEAKKLFNDCLKLLKAKSSKLKAELVIAPPFVYLEPLSKFLKAKSSKLKAKIGAQDVFYENSNAYTGEISPKMLKNLGVEYVIVGHSERRKYLSAEGGSASGGNETDEMINKKVLAVLKAGLKVILCVGEPTQRGQTRTRRGPTRNIKWAKNYVKKQLQKDLKGIAKSYKLKANNLIMAYEPIWAINTSHSDTPEDALEMIKFIKKILNAKPYTLNPKVLYGGSVDSKNIADFLKHPEIDGVLVGGASLKAGEVKKIIEITAKIV